MKLIKRGNVRERFRVKSLLDLRCCSRNSDEKSYWLNFVQFGSNNEQSTVFFEEFIGLSLILLIRK